MSKPEPYELDDPQEITRLIRELRGYMQTSLNNGTDRQGRVYALKALADLEERSDAIESACELVLYGYEMAEQGQTLELAEWHRELNHQLSEVHA